MGFFHQAAQILQAAVVLLHRHVVAYRVPVIAGPFENGHEPDGVGAQIHDLIQALRDGSQIPAGVEAAHKDLVDNGVPHPEGIVTLSHWTRQTVLHLEEAAGLTLMALGIAHGQGQPIRAIHGGRRGDGGDVLGGVGNGHRSRIGGVRLPQPAADVPVDVHRGGAEELQHARGLGYAHQGLGGMVADVGYLHRRAAAPGAAAVPGEGLKVVHALHQGQRRAPLAARQGQVHAILAGGITAHQTHQALGVRGGAATDLTAGRHRMATPGGNAHQRSFGGHVRSNLLGCHRHQPTPHCVQTGRAPQGGVAQQGVLQIGRLHEGRVVDIAVPGFRQGALGRSQLRHATIHRRHARHLGEAGQLPGLAPGAQAVLQQVHGKIGHQTAPAAPHRQRGSRRQRGVVRHQAVVLGRIQVGAGGLHQANGETAQAPVRRVQLISQMVRRQGGVGRGHKQQIHSAVVVQHAQLHAHLQRVPQGSLQQLNCLDVRIAAERRGIGPGARAIVVPLRVQALPARGLAGARPAESGGVTLHIRHGHHHALLAFRGEGHGDAQAVAIPAVGHSG